MTALKILFFCIGNTCRSPMAEAITRGLGGASVRAASAGLRPFGRIVGGTERALGRLGYDSRGLTSKRLDTVDLQDFDIIVSLLGNAGLAYLPPGLGADVEAWPIGDPYGEDDEVYLAAARELERRIRDLLEDRSARELTIV
jgi:arsenate reductase